MIQIKQKLKYSLLVLGVIAACSMPLCASADDSVSSSQGKEIDCETANDYKNVSAMKCYMERLDILNEKMKGLLNEIYSSQTSIEGAEADKEIKGKIQTAQTGWEQYRENHCAFNYYTKARVHSSSLTLAIARCKYLMTHDRIEEIKSTYENF